MHPYAESTSLVTCSLDSLEARFRSLWAAASGSDPEGVWRHLLLRYSEPWRHYHHFGHISHLLDLLDRYRSLAVDSVACELAVWFHDFVYVPGSTKNEILSAEDFLALAGGISPARRDAVKSAILATCHMRHFESLSSDSTLVADIDLACLAVPPSVFDSDSHALGLERYACGLDDTASPRFLSALFFREAGIYRTPSLRDVWEPLARANLSRVLRQWSVSSLHPPYDPDEIAAVRCPRYVAVEGVDGTGKSTLASHLALRLGYRLFHSPAAPFSDPVFRSQLDALPTDHVRPWAYRAACANDAAEIRRLLTLGGVVSDRSPISTWAYAADGFGSHSSPPDWFWTGLPRPDAVVVLTASSSIRDQRLAHRRALAPDRPASTEVLEDHKDLQSRAQSRLTALADHCPEVSLIETDTLDPAAVLAKVLLLFFHSSRHEFPELRHHAAG